MIRTVCDRCKKIYEATTIYSKGFVIDGTFIDFTGTKPIDMDEEKVKIFLAQIGKKLEENTQQ